ncbi:hypothetical protein YC2023_036384 [Brassica napus]
MERILTEVRCKENEVKSFRQGLTEMAGRLGDLEMKRALLEKSMAFLSSKVDKFDGESVLESSFDQSCVVFGKTKARQGYKIHDPSLSQMHPSIYVHSVIHNM